MSEKKFTVFISSTYDDLKEERKAVEETIVRNGDFPVGMEAFPAADEEQFEFIKTIIDQSDYYVLIIAGRYGSLADDGIGYTEKEYQYAVERKIPVLVMLHGKRGSLPADKTEKGDEGRKKLEEFISAVSSARLRTTWETIDGLKLSVLQALAHAKATKPRPGWRRGNDNAPGEVLAEMVQLQRENRELHSKLDEVSGDFVVPDDIASLDKEIGIRSDFEVRIDDGDFHEQTYYHPAPLSEVFGWVAPHLITPCLEYTMRSVLANSVADALGFLPRNIRGQELRDADFQNIKVQLLAHGLVDVYSDRNSNGTDFVWWRLTKKGVNQMMNLRVLRESDED